MSVIDEAKRIMAAGLPQPEPVRDTQPEPTGDTDPVGPVLADTGEVFPEPDEPSPAEPTRAELRAEAVKMRADGLP